MTWLKLKFAAGVAAAVLAAGGAVTVAALGAADADSAPDQKFATRLVKAVEDNDYETFMKDGDAAFKTLTKQNLEAVSLQLAKRLKAGHQLIYLGELKQYGYRVTIWKLTFKDGGDDVLAKLSTKGGKVGGFWLQ